MEKTDGMRDYEAMYNELREALGCAGESHARSLILARGFVNFQRLRDAHAVHNCGRAAYHEGPCNGLPRRDCPGFTKGKSVIWWMVAAALACIALMVLSVAAQTYLEIKDPCVKWEERGTNVYMFGGIKDGGTAMVRPNRVCVARKSGWRE